MKKVILVLLLLMVLTGCSIVRIETNSIDNILSVILTKENKLFNTDLWITKLCDNMF